MGEGRAVCAEEAALNWLWKQWPDIQDTEDHLHQTTMKPTSRMHSTTTESLIKPTRQISNITV